jgi:competence protein ComEA
MRPILSAFVARAATWARTSVWTRPALRVVLVFAFLLVLAKIGRAVTTATAAVGGPVPPAAAPPLPSDAGAPTATDAAVVAPAPAPAVDSERATADDPVYLNEATADDLRRLPGVGEKRARAILELRSKLGRFRQIEELLRVKGIGRATLKKLRPLVRLERAALDAGVDGAGPSG